MTEGGVTPIGFGVHPNGTYQPYANVRVHAHTDTHTERDTHARARAYRRAMHRSWGCVVVFAFTAGPFNAYNAKHYSGGSSGGSAVVVALGICPVAIGFDGGGSIRTPAALSGVFGERFRSLDCLFNDPCILYTQP